MEKIGLEFSDKELEVGPITDLEKLKCVAEAIEAAKNKMIFNKISESMEGVADKCIEDEVGELTDEQVNKSIGSKEDESMEEHVENIHETVDESIREEINELVEEQHMISVEDEIDESMEEQIDDSDYGMTNNDANLDETSEEVLFPPIKQGLLSENASNCLEEIREQMLMNDATNDDDSLRPTHEQENDKEMTNPNNELEKIQLQILVDNIQAAEAEKETQNEENSRKSSEQPKKMMLEWNDTETLPERWKLKKTRKMSFVKELFLSPREYIFSSRREALKSLIENGANTDEIEYMRISLKHEDWEDSAYLPEGWKFRKTKFQTFFCTVNGNLLKSCEEALGHIKAEHPNLTESYLSAFKIQVNTENVKEGWKTSDSIPTGWKIKRANGKKAKVFLLSPEGIQFSSRVRALQHLTKEKYDEEDIAVMRGTLMNEKYAEDHNLPAGWTYKKLLSRNQTLVLTSFGDILDSYKKVMLYTQFLGIHSSEDVGKLESFYRPKSSEMKSSRFNWVNDASVPDGWKVRYLRGKIVSFLDPKGKQFKTRSAILQHCIKNKASPALMEEIRKGLAHEGWNESNNLPSGWMFKKNRKNIFLSREGIVIKEIKNALAYIRRRISKNYSHADLEKSFIPTRNIKCKDSLWITDPTIPNGWKMKKSETATAGRNSFLSPDGSKFQSRKKAYLHMISQNYSRDEISAMRDKLSVEGWEENELLPEGWIFKIKESYEELIFITSEGSSFRDSKFKVLEYARTLNKYNESDVEGIEMFYEIEYSRRIAEKYEWIESDETVPEGWKYRLSGSDNEKMHFLSPEGRTFPNRIAALKQMISSKRDEREIEAIRSKLSYEGWNDDELLPQGWKYKVQVHGSKHFINMLHRDGFELNDGEAKVVEFLTKAVEYTDDDIQRMGMFFEIHNNKQKKMKYVWLENEDIIPYGWKFRALEGKNSRKVFLSPDGHELSTRHSALFYMISSSYQEEEIEEMRNSLMAEGWETSNCLPSGWRFKSLNTEKLFLSQNGEIIRGFSAALASIHSEEDCDEYDIKNFLNMKGMDEFTWLEDDDTVPYGWKVGSTANYKESVIMSPDNVQFPNRILAFQHMLKIDNDHLEVEDMRDKLVHEGWNESSYLPDGWKFKKIEGLVHLLSKEGEIFAKDPANEATYFMKNSILYTEENIDNLEIFLQLQVSSRQVYEKDQRLVSNWLEDDTIPRGWSLKLKDEKNFGKLSIRSPNGVSYPSRKVALQSLIGSGSSQEELAAMRKHLGHENWKESELLPVNWFYKLQASNDVVLLTDAGKELKAKETTLEYIKNCEGFLNEDCDRINMFFEMKFAQKRMLKREWVEGDESVPAGWKVNSKNTLLSPDGTSYASRKLALKALIKSERSQEEIEEMRGKMSHEGWKISDMLPDRWLYKRFGTKTIKIVSREGVEIKDSKQNAIVVMKEHNYSREDLERLETFFEMVYAEGRLSSIAWKEDTETLPNGWKYRIQNKSGKNNFLCPEGLPFSSRKAGYQHMIENKYDPAEISEMRQKLVHESWQFHDLLPRDWMYKLHQYGNRTIFFILSSEGTEMKDSKVMVTDFMRSLDKYHANDVDNLTKFFEMEGARQKSVVKETMEYVKQEKLDWSEVCSSLPEGWKFCKGEGIKEHFLSPDNFQFTSRTESLKHMVSTKFYSEQQINEMREHLESEGWMKHSDLPHNWLFKEKRPDSMMLITPEGEVLESMKTGLDVIKNIYDEVDVIKMKKFIRQQSSSSYRNHIKQEFVEKDVEVNEECEKDKTCEAILDDSDLVREKAEEPEVEQYNGSMLTITTKPFIKQEVTKPSPKFELDTDELENILEKGNFTSSVINQIHNERKKTRQELDLAELNTVLTEGNFTQDIIGQIMRKMNNPNNNINLDSHGMQETMKRKTEELEGELKRFKKRFF